MLLIFSLIVVYFQDLDCLGDACLAEENKFLIDVLDLLAEEMDSCEKLIPAWRWSTKLLRQRREKIFSTFAKTVLHVSRR